ncbi:MAG: ankyrin repeat domain-containing protein, partial [Leptospiraceae bacterium]|nr:ankyrin repeat domain-containing protein [Leptospiraceae bacterium]
DLNKVKSLVGRGANVNYGRRSGRCFKGATPLWEATNQYKYEIASYLVSKGADVNKQDDYGWTPLYLTAQKGPWTLLNYY